MLCPDTTLINEFYKIKNHYGNLKNRISFSLEIIECNS